MPRSRTRSPGSPAYKRSSDNTSSSRHSKKSSSRSTTANDKYRKQRSRHSPSPSSSSRAHKSRHRSPAERSSTTSSSKHRRSSRSPAAHKSSSSSSKHYSSSSRRRSRSRDSSYRRADATSSSKDHHHRRRRDDSTSSSSSSSTASSASSRAAASPQPSAFIPLTSNKGSHHPHHPRRQCGDHSKSSTDRSALDRPFGIRPGLTKSMFMLTLDNKSTKKPSTTTATSAATAPATTTFASVQQLLDEPIQPETLDLINSNEFVAKAFTSSATVKNKVASEKVLINLDAETVSVPQHETIEAVDPVFNPNVGVYLRFKEDTFGYNDRIYIAAIRRRFGANGEMGEKDVHVQTESISRQLIPYVYITNIKHHIAHKIHRGQDSLLKKYPNQFGAPVSKPLPWSATPRQMVRRNRRSRATCPV